MFLLSLLACGSPASVTGDYLVEFSEQSTDCGRDDVPRASGLEVLRFYGDEAVEVLPFGDTCVGPVDAFECELAPWDATADYAAAGFDAFVAQDLDFAGSLGAFGGGAGTLTWATTCTGAECAAVATATPPLCTTTWAWAATRRDSEVESCDPQEVDLSGLAALGEAPWDPLQREPEPG